MKERPMLFSGPMVRAILSGAKTQTRRLIKPQPPPVDAVRQRSGIDFSIFTDHRTPGVWRVAGPVWAVREMMESPPEWRCPFGVPGDRLWCRERARVLDYSTGPVADGVTGTLARLRYEADGAEAWVPFPSRLWTVTEGHCVPNGVFREGARLWLEVVSVRVERLHDISEEDARAEGVQPRGDGSAAYRAAFRLLWCELYGHVSWDANPWLWCVGFRSLP